ncbi:MAG: hypothetical protein LBL90_07170 [Prevotellaceae bacterium]|jgi:hypothetical protein|nr:hypothetical protein [Prevotellaceae bacterium]
MIELRGKYNNNCKIFIDEIKFKVDSLIQHILDDEVSKSLPVLIMPDTHVSTDIVIEFTMPVGNMLNPNYIGVNIGCDILSVQLSDNLNNFDLK